MMNSAVKGLSFEEFQRMPERNLEAYLAGIRARQADLATKLQLATRRVFQLENEIQQLEWEKNRLQHAAEKRLEAMAEGKSV
jgi:hypothetical protein